MSVYTTKDSQISMPLLLSECLKEISPVYLEVLRRQLKEATLLDATGLERGWVPLKPLCAYPPRIPFYKHSVFFMQAESHRNSVGTNSSRTKRNYSGRISNPEPPQSISSTSRRNTITRIPEFILKPILEEPSQQI